MGIKNMIMRKAARKWRKDGAEQYTAAAGGAAFSERN